MSAPTVVALEASHAALTSFLISVRAAAAEHGAPDHLSNLLDDWRASTGPMSFRVSMDGNSITTRVSAPDHSTAAALAGTVRAHLEVLSARPLRTLIVARGSSRTDLIRHMTWPSGLEPWEPDVAPAATPGFTLTRFGANRFRAALTFTGAPPSSARYAVENLVASVWMGARDSVAMQRLREETGLVYFPFMTYDWHPESPAWHVSFEGDWARHTEVRARLRETSSFVPPTADLGQHISNTLRSLDAVELAPEAHLALGQQLGGRGLDGHWLRAFRHAITVVDERSFALGWASMMKRMQEHLDD